ncbi:hypothetical protein ACHAXR_011403 [Thalassiosira sp. AJA248-18]
MKFWKRSGSQSTDPPVKRDGNGSSSSLKSSLDNGAGIGTLSRKAISEISSQSIPTRKQRMRLLKCIIHHADAVQRQYLVPKQLSSPTTPKTNSSSIFIRTDTTTAEINDKCYQRWHQVLQEGLVPMSVHALNLLHKSATASSTTTTGGGAIVDDEEEAYFATMEGMEEEIQVMAILARAAALNDIPTSSEDDKKNTAEHEDGMEQINDMMKCTAMLLFHIVLAASSSDESSEEKVNKEAKDSVSSSAEATKTVAGYDGRVRHVMKLACIDVLTRAIVDSVENSNISIADNQEEQSSGPYDMDEYSLWNIANIKTFLDQTDLGKDVIFGTPFKPPSDPPLNRSASSGALEVSGRGEKTLEAGEENQNRGERLNQTSGTEQTAVSADISTQSQSEIDGPQVSTLGEKPLNSGESMGSIDTSDSSVSLEVLAEEAIESETRPTENNPPIEKGEEDHDNCDRHSHSSNRSKEEQESNTNEGDITQQGDEEGICASNHSEEGQGEKCETNAEENEDEIVKEQHARRQFNAKFLATRKFELIERLVAVDIVRFLMAEERKLHEKELEEQNNKRCKKLPTYLETDVNDDDVQCPKNEDSTDNLGDPNHDDNTDENSDQGNAGSYFTASRVKKIKRGAKIAGAGLALGTVFAITGGLAAPALAAGIGGIAALTGASTASSTAVLAVLATFKAGAALFGVGGGGLAAYKMKKRTAGLSQFEIRRENIEQYMYEGASDEKMRKGIEAMLPQLHTTVAVTGWLRENDIADFQLAWGIQPTCQYKKEDDEKCRLRQMKRFYSVYNPPLVYLCEHFMQTLQKRLKKDFSWDRQLENKYGANPDHILPLDAPHDNEVFLSYEEKEMIDGVLNHAKIDNLRKRGFGTGDGIDFNEGDEIGELLAKVTPKKRERKLSSETDHELSAMENELVSAMDNDLALNGSDSDMVHDEIQVHDEVDEQKTEINVNESEGAGPILSVSIPNNDAKDAEQSPTLQQRMAKQREQQVSFLKGRGMLDDESNLQEGAGSPKMTGAAQSDDAQDPPVTNHEIEEDVFDDERLPVVWDWKRLYGTSDIHTVTWESDMLSSLCHIVENMALEVSSQATKVALQYSVIGAIISAVAIPSALVTASKLIDDPYQIVVIRADEAGKELARCLLQSDERRPVTLVGFSFGARVIYSCLRELARQQDIWEQSRATPKPNGNTAEEHKSKRNSFLKKKSTSTDEHQFLYDREPASLVGDVIFIGLPRAIDKKVLTSCRRVTGGRLVNCYARNDWLLSLMFVARGGTPCGVKAIKDVPGVENYDVTEMVESHMKYADAIPNILQKVRFSEP